MENETQSKNIYINEIGNIAKMIDKEMTIFERMKIKSDSLKKMGFALFFYLVTMIIFALFL